MAKREVRHTKLAASTILEVVVAMVIIVMVLGISMMIYTNVMRLSLSSQKLRAQFVLEQEMVKLEANSSYNDDREKYNNGWQVEKEITPYEEGSILRKVHLTLYDRNHEKLAELRKIIIRHETK